MTKQFYPLRIKHIDRDTPECTVLWLGVGPELANRFRFRAGQHLTVRARIGDEEVRRSYSLCSSPSEGEWKIAVKKVPEGRFSAFANQVLQVGDTIEVMPPHGNFFVEPAPGRQRHFVAFAAGSGITPIASMIKTLLQEEPGSSFQLFYVNRAVATIMFREELEGLKNRYLDRFEVFHFLTRESRDIPLFNGRLTPEKLDLIFKVLVDKASVDEFFLCGPGEMIFTIRDYLTGSGISGQKIHFELFNTEGVQQTRYRREAEIKRGKSAAITIWEGGKSFTFTTERLASPILETALEQHPDLPFACKGGVCCTCKAKLLEGQVEMNVNYALEQEQLDAGYILTCQAVPISDTIVVDYDV